MRVVIAKIDDCGYMGTRSDGFPTYRVFGNWSLAEEWIRMHYTKVELLPNIRFNNTDQNYRCVAKAHTIHYIHLTDQEVIEKIEL